MCGAIALALPGRLGAAGPDWRYLAGRVLYNLGRITTYSVLGAAAGLAGQSLQIAGWQQGLSITSGVLILLLVVVPERYKAQAARPLGLDRLLTWVKQTLTYFFQQHSWQAFLLTGALNGLLPCGLVYLALAGALAMPGMGGAVAYMALFGLGTLPLLLGLSLTGRLVPLAWRRRLTLAVPYLATVLALLFIVRGLGLGIPYMSPRLSPPAAAQSGLAQPRSVHYCH
jgi:sulfite exporter TauE/SafE